MTRIMTYASIVFFVATLTFAHLSIESKEEIPAPEISAFQKFDLENNDACNYGKSVEGQDVVVIKNMGFGVTGADKVHVAINATKHVKNGYMEFRLDKIDGPVILTLPINFAKSSNGTIFKGLVSPFKGQHDLYIVFSPDLHPSNVSWFEFEVSGPIPGEYYILMSRLHGKAITIELASTKDQAFARMFPFTYGTHQMFRFEKVNSTAYKIIARHSEKVLEVQLGKFTDNSWVTQATYNDSLQQQQQWYIDSAGEGTVKMMSRLTGRCLTIHSYSPNDNVNLVQYGCANTAPQKWYLLPIC